MVRKPMTTKSNFEMKKPKIEIFIPAGVCSCSFSKWIENIYDKLEDFMDDIEIETLDSNSTKAKALNINGQTLMLNGKRIPVFLIKEKLKTLIK